jgi:hypothetical protein
MLIFKQKLKSRRPDDMKGKWASLVMAMAGVFLAVTAGLGAKVLFEDNFTTFDPAWGEASDIVNVKDGKMFISPKNKTQLVLNQANLLPNDLEASVTITFIQSDAPVSGSLVFWAKDRGDFYNLNINPNGRFAVSHWLGRWLEPVSWRASDALKKGVGAVNQVKLVTKGNRGTVFFNGKEVISFSGQPPQGGGLIGFYVDSGGVNSVTFSDFKVTEP